MYELVKSMLSISSWFTPQDGSGRIIDPLATSCYVLAVGLHIALLEVGRKAMHVLKYNANAELIIVAAIASSD